MHIFRGFITALVAVYRIINAKASCFPPKSLLHRALLIPSFHLVQSLPLLLLLLEIIVHPLHVMMPRQLFYLVSFPLAIFRL